MKKIIKTLPSILTLILVILLVIIIFIEKDKWNEFVTNNIYYYAIFTAFLAIVSAKYLICHYILKY